MNYIKKCIQCIYFAESMGYCSLHDRDVTRYNGCKDYTTKREYNDKMEEEDD